MEGGSRRCKLSLHRLAPLLASIWWKYLWDLNNMWKITEQHKIDKDDIRRLAEFNGWKLLEEEDEFLNKKEGKLIPPLD